MSTNLQIARRERALMKPQPVESVAGATMRAVAGAMIVLGAIAFGLALMRGASAIAWEAYLVNLLFFLGVLGLSGIPATEIAPGYDGRFGEDRFGIVVRCDEAEAARVETIMKESGAEEVAREGV